MGELPQAELVLAGARLLAAARDGTSVRVLADVADLEAVHASVYAAPVLTGGGLTFKVPQAMLHGLAVVATPVAAEGLDHWGAPPLSEASPDASAWAAALLGLLSDEPRRAELGARARDWSRALFVGPSPVLDDYRGLLAAR